MLRAVWLQDRLRRLRPRTLRRKGRRRSRSSHLSNKQPSPRAHVVSVGSTKPLPLPHPPLLPQQPAVPPHAPHPSTPPLHQGTGPSSRMMGMMRTGFLTPVGQRKGWTGRI